MNKDVAAQKAQMCRDLPPINVGPSSSWLSGISLLEVSLSSSMAMYRPEILQLNDLAKREDMKREGTRKRPNDVLRQESDRESSRF